MFYPLACLLDASKTIVAESQRSGRANREMESPRFTPKPNLFVSTLHSLRQKKQSSRIPNQSSQIVNFYFSQCVFTVCGCIRSGLITTHTHNILPNGPFPMQKGSHLIVRVHIIYFKECPRRRSFVHMFAPCEKKDSCFCLSYEWNADISTFYKYMHIKRR